MTYYLGDQNRKEYDSRYWWLIDSAQIVKWYFEIMDRIFTLNVC